MHFHNSELHAMTSTRYGSAKLLEIEAAMRAHGTLTFDRLPTGLFPASHLGVAATQSGYDNVWVRDNVYVAYAHLIDGQPRVAAQVARSILTFYRQQRHRFDGIIAGVTDPNDDALRPHARFNGSSLSEIGGPWGHAQNDALGYLLWLCAQLAREGHLNDDLSWSTLLLLPRYFGAIQFWKDEDSGHWEETRKISASSIGVVVAGLKALLALAEERPAIRATWLTDEVLRLVCDLANCGRTAMENILPNECAQMDPAKNRRYDAALAFLIFPLEVIDDSLANLLLHDIDRYLAGEFGIRRYLRDSFWSPNYETLLEEYDRTRDFSRDVATRDALLQDIGGEAQWCIFDPLLSAYFGKRFSVKRDDADLERQVHHFNRALAQVTPSWQCPELYYRNGAEYVPGPQLPLQWTQANLLIALRAMEATVKAKE
jgi:GH15 family glucan-1,4-alpha-glucosidase